MILIKPSFEIIEQEPGFEGILKQIEKVGRTCYKSEDKIKEGSAKKFVDMLTTNCHGAMLEHGTVYLKVLLSNELVLEDAYGENNSVSVYNRYINNKYSKVNCRSGLENVFITDTVEPGYAYITTNLRVLIENDWTKDLQYLCEPTEYHEKRITIKFNHDIGCGREILRHRGASFANESTRYCNYIKDKFGNEITCLIPHFINEENKLEFEEDLTIIENIYFKWIKKGYKAQDARGFLPLFTKSELIVTAFVSDWKHFFDLRTDIAKTGKPHPDLLQVTNPLYKEFINLKLI